MTERLIVGLVEASPRVRQKGRPAVYLPGATSMLRAYSRRYAANPQLLEFLTPIAWRIPFSSSVDRLRRADLVGFSVYVWNAQYSLELARLLKQQRPGRLIVFGGPDVPELSEGFLRRNPCVDLAVHGEGEKVFLDVLERAGSRDWSGIPGVSYIASDGSYRKTPRRDRTVNLDELPSPYLDGSFDDVLAGARDMVWQAIWETNRGCPFSCTFCDWGSATASKVRQFGMERLERELDWLLNNSITTIFVADANFAILPRDVEIARMIAAAAEKRGVRLHLAVQFTKNASDRSAEVQSIFKRSGRISFEPTVSIQSIDHATLVAIKRDNISLKAFENVHARARSEGINNYTDMIIGLPGETYDSFSHGISELIRRGQHDRMVIYACQILPNAEMAGADYRERYGLESVPMLLNPPPRPGAVSAFPPEYIETVIATRSMPRPDWVRAKAFAWMTQFLYYGRVLQIPLMTLAAAFGVEYRRMIEAFASADSARFPIAGSVAAEMMEQARAIQDGHHGFTYSDRFLGLWWSPEVHVLARIGAEDNFEAFYREAESILEMVCAAEKCAVPPRLVGEAVRLNKEMLVRPGAPAETRLTLSYDLPAFHQEVHRTSRGTLREQRVTYAVRHNGERTRDLESWLRFLNASQVRERLARIEEVPTPRHGDNPDDAQSETAAATVAVSS